MPASSIARVRALAIGRSIRWRGGSSVGQRVRAATMPRWLLGSASGLSRVLTQGRMLSGSWTRVSGADRKTRASKNGERTFCMARWRRSWSISFFALRLARMSGLSSV